MHSLQTSAMEYQDILRNNPGAVDISSLFNSFRRTGTVTVGEVMTPSDYNSLSENDKR
jgi:hypothetical protein